MKKYILVALLFLSIGGASRAEPSNIGTTFVPAEESIQTSTEAVLFWWGYYAAGDQIEDDIAGSVFDTRDGYVMAANRAWVTACLFLDSRPAFAYFYGRAVRFAQESERR